MHIHDPETRALVAAQIAAGLIGRGDYSSQEAVEIFRDIARILEPTDEPSSDISATRMHKDWGTF